MPTCEDHVESEAQFKAQSDLATFLRGRCSARKREARYICSLELEVNLSGSGGGTWIDQPGDTCETLSQQTTLNSPDRAVLSQINKGTVLEVSVNKAGKAVTIEALFNGQVAGTITASIIQRLAECMEKGYQYVAEVTDVQGGACRVHIRLK
jgi:hypothetical protein